MNVYLPNLKSLKIEISQQNRIQNLIIKHTTLQSLEIKSFLLHSEVNKPMGRKQYLRNHYYTKNPNLNLLILDDFDSLGLPDVGKLFENNPCIQGASSAKQNLNTFTTTVARRFLGRTQRIKMALTPQVDIF